MKFNFMSISSSFIVIMVGLSFSGCTSVSFSIPASHVEPPMTRGKQLSFGGGIGGETAITYNVISNAANRPPSFNYSPSNSIETPLKGRFSVVPPVDIKLELGPITGSEFLIGEVQVLGEHWVDGKAGNIPVAIFGRYGTSGANNSGSQAYFGGPGGYNWQGSVIAHEGTIGLSAGYQTSPTTLWYLGISRTWINADMNVTQNPSGDGSSQGGTYLLTQDGHTQSLVGGFQVGDTAIFRIFAQYTEVLWSYFAFNSVFEGGLSVDF